MNFTEAYQYTISSIESTYGKDEAMAITNLLFKEHFNSSSLAFLNNDPFLFEEQLKSIVERLQLHEPIQYILGYTYFYNLKISVNQYVLIPRPETEELVFLVKKYIDDRTNTIADICTGSGCIALAVNSMFNGKKIIATDISVDALEIASMNSLQNFSTKNIRFEQHDILSMEWPFEIPDIVICNPPYIGKSEAHSMDDNVLKHEPHLALFVEDDDALLFYKSVIQTFLPLTFPKIFFEINPLFSNELIAYCGQFSLKCETRLDMQGKERFAIVSKS